MIVLNELLEDYGLSERDIAIYQYLHDFGDQPASVIARHLNLQRSSCYTNLQKLSEQGFLKQIIKNSTNYYGAMNSSLILEKLKDKNQHFQHQIQLAQSQLNKLKNQVKKPSNNPKAHYFSGKSGLIQILEDVLFEKPEILRAYISKNFNNFINSHAPDFPTRRAAKKISAHAIHPLGKEDGTWQTNQIKNRLTKSLPPIFDFGIDFLIYKNKIAILSAPEEFGIVIQSDIINQAQTKLFDFVWLYAQPTVTL